MFTVQSGSMCLTEACDMLPYAEHHAPGCNFLKRSAPSLPTRCLIQVLHHRVADVKCFIGLL